MSSLSNLPPGVTLSMIPGNRPEDLEAERLAEMPYWKERGVWLAREFGDHTPAGGMEGLRAVNPTVLLAYMDEIYALEEDRQYEEEMERMYIEAEIAREEWEKMEREL